MCYLFNFALRGKIIYTTYTLTFIKLENNGIFKEILCRYYLPIVSIQLFIADYNKLTGKYICMEI